MGSLRTVLSIFDGMSCGHIALERSGINVGNYYASEIDKYAMKVSAANYPDIIQLGDVTKWHEWDIDWASVDLFIGGSPCQGLSLVGKQLAFDDPRSALFFEYLNILEHIRKFNPKVKFMLENVKMKKEHLDVFTEKLGVEYTFINSALVSAQNRQRYYWANWDFSVPKDQGIYFPSVVKDIRMLPATVRKGSPRPINLTGLKFLCLTATYYKGIRADGRPALSTRAGVFDELREAGDCRMLTPLECERLQTVPDNYTNHVSNTQRYKMLGNGWTVDVIAHIFRGLK